MESDAHGTSRGFGFFGEVGFRGFRGVMAEGGSEYSI